MKHTCIKKGCGITYHDEEADDYYCEVHLEEHRALIAQLDGSRQPVEKTLSDLEVFDSVAKTKSGTQMVDGILVKRTQSFARASDIMGE